jgi:hypothetical protein
VSCLGAGFCDELITLSQESCRMCVSVCDLETWTVRRFRPDLSCFATKKNCDAVYKETHAAFVGIVTRLRDGRLKKWSSISGKD